MRWTKFAWLARFQGAAFGGVLVLGILVSFVIVLFIWAAFTQVEQVSKAQGQVIASSRTQLIQVANDGVIDEIMVHEGSRVKKGELLIKLDDKQAKAALLDSQAKVAALKAAQARLESEVFNRPLKFPAEVKPFPQFIQNQTELFERKQRAFHDDIAATEQVLGAVREELNLNLPLMKSGDISKADVIRLRRAVAELQGSLSSRRNKYFQDAQAEMTKVEEELETQEQIYTDRKINLDRMSVYAPTDGLVRNIRITTPGAKVRGGDVVMEVLPTDSNLVIEAKLKPTDIAFIKLGAPVAVKLDAYDYSIYGILHGKLSFISPDALVEDTREGTHVYYRVRVTVPEQARHQTAGGKEIEIQPGMTAQIDIKTGSQSMLTYLTKPIVKTVSESFSER